MGEGAEAQDYGRRIPIGRGLHSSEASRYGSSAENWVIGHDTAATAPSHSYLDLQRRGRTTGAHEPNGRDNQSRAYVQQAITATQRDTSHITVRKRLCSAALQWREPLTNNRSASTAQESSMASTATTSW